LDLQAIAEKPTETTSRNIVFRRSKFPSKNSNLLMNKSFDFGELNNWAPLMWPNVSLVGLLVQSFGVALFFICILFICLFKHFLVVWGYHAVHQSPLPPFEESKHTQNGKNKDAAPPQWCASHLQCPGMDWSWEGIYLTGNSISRPARKAEAAGHSRCSSSLLSSSWFASCEIHSIIPSNTIHYQFNALDKGSAKFRNAMVLLRKRGKAQELQSSTNEDQEL